MQKSKSRIQDQPFEMESSFPHLPSFSAGWSSKLFFSFEPLVTFWRPFSTLFDRNAGLATAVENLGSLFSMSVLRFWSPLLHKKKSRILVSLHVDQISCHVRLASQKVCPHLRGMVGFVVSVPINQYFDALKSLPRRASGLMHTPNRISVTQPEDRTVRH
jgi:hypothetical protein